MPTLQNKLSVILLLILSASIAYITFCLQAFNGLPGDLPTHVNLIKPIISGEYYVPHPLFHYSVSLINQGLGLLHIQVSLLQTAIILLTCLVCIISYLIYRIAWHIIGDFTSPFVISALAFVLIIVTPVFVPFFNPRVYLGQWSPNIWHNPTMFMIKPFAFLILFIYAKWLISQTENRISVLVLLSALTLFSVWAKPSFIFSFLPAVLFFYMLRFRQYQLAHYLKTILIFLPALAVLLWQYLRTYHSDLPDSGGLKDSIIFTAWGVTKLFTPNVFISFLLALAFPLFVLLSNLKSFYKNHFLVLSWLNTLVAYAQASFLAEEQKFGMGNFTFGYSLSLSILFTFSTIHFLQVSHEKNPARKTNVIFISGMVLLAAHFISGVYYYVHYLTAHTFS